jgi:hypothetical protein
VGAVQSGHDAVGVVLHPGPQVLPARDPPRRLGLERGSCSAKAWLYITVRTVSSHLDWVRDKTGCRHADLARLALSTGLV